MSLLKTLFPFAFAEQTYQFTDRRGDTWYLHRLAVPLKNNNDISTVYYFAKTKNKRYACKFPDGFKVMRTKTGMPLLKHK